MVNYCRHNSYVVTNLNLDNYQDYKFEFTDYFCQALKWICDIYNNSFEYNDIVILDSKDVKKDMKLLGNIKDTYTNKFWVLQTSAPESKKM